MPEEQEKRARPPYASMAQIEALFERMVRMGDPGTVDKTWVENYKLAPTQPQAIVALLRWLGVIDKNGTSLGVWDDLRVPATRQAKLEELVRASYRKVFDLIDVTQATREDLEGTFIQAYKSGDPGRPVTCFIGLCKQARIAMIADVRPQGGDVAEPPKKVKKSEERELQKKVVPAIERKRGGGGQRQQTVTISVNVEIPAGWSEEQIRERLEAVRRATQQDGTADGS